MHKKLEPKVRKDQIMAAALAVAADAGFQNVTRERIADAATCSPASISNHFGTMTQMKRAIMRAAVNRKVLPIIAQGLAVRDPQALKAPEETKQAALKQLSKSV